MKKKIIIGCSFLLGVASAFGQGTVNFNNLGLIMGNPPSILVSYEPGVPLVGTNFVAQLYYGPPGATDGSLIPVASPPATFRPPNTTIPGTWIGGTRTLWGFTDAMPVTLQVRVWDITIAPDYASAFAWGNGLFTATGALFDYTVPFSASPPAAFLMANFQGFSMAVPEPSTPSLISLGLFFGFFFKRLVRRK